MKKVIVTGATGFIGSHICKTLLEQGVEVYGIGRNKDKLNFFLEYKNFHPVILEFEEYDNIDVVIKDRNFDCFIHAAWFGVNGKEKKEYSIQLKNTIIACDAIKKAKQLECRRFVLLGSVDEFESCFIPDDEFLMPSHARIYGLSKFVAENIGKTIAVEVGIEYVSALLSLTYGEGNKTNILPNMIIRNAEKNSPIDLIIGENYFDMIYIDDAVKGILAVAEKGRNMESYFIGHTELKTFRKYVEEICKILNTNIELRFGAYMDSASVVSFNNIRREKITEDTGFKCKTSLKEGILKTQKWILKQ